MVVGLPYLLYLFLFLSCRTGHALPGAVRSDFDEDLAISPGEPHFLNEWAIHIPGGEDEANELALEMGYTNQGQIGPLTGYYRFIKDDHPSRTKRSAHHHTKRLMDDHRVHWAEQQYSISRVKRDFINKRDQVLAYRSVNFNDREWMQQWYLPHVNLDACYSFYSMDADESLFDFTDEEVPSDSTYVNDPLSVCQFYLGFDPSKEQRDLGITDLRVVPAWAKNITGNGVVCAVLDDGLERDHPDLAENFDPDASYDFNRRKPDPMPRYDASNENKHGTRCAGEIAMVANNSKCGIGVAFNARIGGITMLDGTVTDSLEAEALAFNIQHIDIYSASWGPNDDGKTVEGPGEMATKALKKGVTEGRGGKGVIYAWASGNGGSSFDNCNCDGYTGSIYTISISSVSQNLGIPWYGEKCASTMASTYSSGTPAERRITSTDLHGKCTTAHTGTSASAPLAAGIFALVLEANRNLTWRDMQHLVTYTSDPFQLMTNDGWSKNAAGFYHNNALGFGLLRAADLINAADGFVTVPEKSICYVDSENENDAGLPLELRTGNEVVVKINATGCKGQDSEVNHLEHVVLVLDMNYTKRGNLEVLLTSPSGTESQLLTQRPKDNSSRGFENWGLMSVRFWGENPAGVWELKIADRAKGKKASGIVNKVRIEMHGTKTQPHHIKANGGKRTYPDLSTDKIEQRLKEAEEVKAKEELEDRLEELRQYMRLGISDKRPKPTSTQTPTSSSISPSSLHSLSSSELSENLMNYMFGEGDEISAENFDEESSKSDNILSQDFYDLKSGISDSSFNSQKSSREPVSDDIRLSYFQPKNDFYTVFKNYKRIYPDDTEEVIQFPDVEEDRVDSHQGYFEDWPQYSHDEFDLPIIPSYSNSDI